MSRVLWDALAIRGWAHGGTRGGAIPKRRSYWAQSSTTTESRILTACLKRVLSSGGFGITRATGLHMSPRLRLDTVRTPTFGRIGDDTDAIIAPRKRSTLGGGGMRFQIRACVCGHVTIVPQPNNLLLRHQCRKRDAWIRGCACCGPLCLEQLLLDVYGDITDCCRSSRDRCCQS